MARKALLLVLALAARGAAGFSVALPRLALRRPAAAGTLGIGDFPTPMLRNCRISGVPLRISGDDVFHGAAAIMAGGYLLGVSGIVQKQFIKPASTYDAADESAVVETEKSPTEQAAMAAMTAVVDSSSASLAEEEAAAVAFQAQEDAAVAVPNQHAEENAASVAAAAAAAAALQDKKEASAALAKKQAEAEAKMVAEAATAAKEAEEQSVKSTEKEAKQQAEPVTAASISSVHKCGFGGTAPAAAYYPRDAAPAETAPNLRKVTVATRPLTTTDAPELEPSLYRCGVGGTAPAAAYYPRQGATALDTAVIATAAVRMCIHSLWAHACAHSLCGCGLIDRWI